jgi:hypothetical protein
MKTKNIIILGGIAFAIYYLTKNKSKSISVTDTTPKKNDVSEGANLGNDELDTKISEKEKLKLFNQANNFYRGGVEPPKGLIARLSIAREQAKLKLQTLGLLEEFKKWKATVDRKRKEEEPYPMMDKPRRIGVPPRNVNDRRKGNPLRPIETRDRVSILYPMERTRTFPTYAFDSGKLGLTNEPRMAV